ncbi:hypothetical protein BHE74_00004500 [Ensete ventricosum]|nr:hypothetical protein GW17_00002193 [Ensete ventricosum]RWW86712.1 hypothetical protein BHE74_00004500 [Ensete ventricosum]RZR96229.1 hypothetical protein BHM03_00025221 [Ensete ventricosum]
MCSSPLDLDRGGASTPSSGRGRTPSSSLGVPEVSADENSNEKNRHYHLPGEPAGDRLSGRSSRRDAGRGSLRVGFHRRNSRFRR